MPSFVHLHVHTEYSLLDGLARLEDLAARTKELGMDTLAVTDHGVMYAMIDLCKAADHHGIKPIIGCEVYVAPRSHTQRDPKLDVSPYHLVLLARDAQGYQNLVQLTSKANVDGFYYKPRVDHDLLTEYAAGLTCLSACASGEIPRLVMAKKRDEAERLACWHRDVFGPDHYFLELQVHEALPELVELNAILADMSARLGIPLVATNDSHYVKREDASAQELLLCIQTNTTIDDPKHMRMAGDDYYLRSPEEMATLFKDYPSALENTVRIAAECDFRLANKGYHLPIFEVPDGLAPEVYLRRICEQGLNERYSPVTDDLRTQLDYELSVIHQMGFDAYFLIVWDLVHFAKSHGILVGPGRGSAAGSMVSYCLRITDLEPRSNNLIFERFLNPGRVTMPDIDLDFPDDRREELIEYAVSKYGQEKVAQIITFGTMAAKAAIRDAGRALGMPLNEVDQVAKLVPVGPKVTLQSALTDVAELKQMYDGVDTVHGLIDKALALEGVARHASTHAAGVVIADKPLTHYVPLQIAPRGEGLVTQYTMEALDLLGLLKIDFLGLSTLTILQRCLNHIETKRGLKIKPIEIPLDDPATYELLTSGEVTGVFQVESPGMRKTLVNLKPTKFEDVVVLLSLFRPGPMQFIDKYIAIKEGREEVSYRHQALEPILKDTNGIIVYQEQIIRIATDLAGYSAGEADLMRRAVGKKKAKDLEMQHGKFLAGAQAKGIPQEAAEQIFADIEFFANYGFNKAHSAAYSVITCQTAYLKAHYPVEYMGAMLSVERGNLEKVAMLIAECRRLGIEVRPPDVNASGADFTIEGTPDGPRNLGHEPMAIRFGLAAIKNVGDGPIDILLKARGDRPFANVDDFCRRVDLRQINKRVLECLIKSGAMDCLGTRGQLLAAIDRMVGVSQEVHLAAEIGQLSLFGGALGGGADVNFLALPEVPTIPSKDQLAWEKELLGLYISQHPLNFLPLGLTYVTRTAQLDETMADRRVLIMGMVSNVHTITTKKGDPMAFVTVEDLSGSVEVVVFPRMLEDTKDLWAEDRLVVVKGKVNVRDGRATIIVDQAREYDPKMDGQGTLKEEKEPASRPVANNVAFPARPAARPTRIDERPPDEAAVVVADAPDLSEPPEEPPLPGGFEEAPAVAARPAVRESAPARHVRHLRVTFRRSGDEEADKHKLGEVYRLLKGRPGEVSFCFFVASSGGGRVQLEFPDVTTAYSPSLCDELSRRFGPDTVTVDWAG